VSILSNLSTLSRQEEEERAKGGGGGRRGGKGGQGDSAFHIEGIDHALLSRGKLSAAEQYELQKGGGGGGSGASRVGRGRGKAAQGYENEKQARKRERKQRAKGHGRDKRDELGVLHEGALCEELWAHAQTALLARCVHDLCLTLMLLHGSGHGSAVDDISLAASLQLRFDAFTLTLQRNPPPLAPLYPHAWLASRSMLSVRRYQEGSVVASWWRVAAEGVALWRESLKMTVLARSEEEQEKREKDGEEKG